MTGSRPLDLLAGHFAGGGAFFTACGLLAAAAGLRWWAGRPVSGVKAARRPNRAALAVAAVGAAVLVLSACPLPVGWDAAAWAAPAAWAWLAGPLRGRGQRLGGTATLLAVLLAGVGWELTWWTGPRVGPVAEREALVVGDSLTAGVGGEASLWPALLAERRGVPVSVRAVAGARLAAPLGVPPWDLPETGGLVVVELGGNDLLSGGDPARLEEDLRELLTHLRALTADRGGRVVLLGLPLPPLHAAYGRAQRAVCRDLDVPLVPRRVLTDVLFAPGATVDGLHLSPAGHAALADAVWAAVGDALPPDLTPTGSG